MIVWANALSRPFPLSLPYFMSRPMRRILSAILLLLASSALARSDDAARLLGYVPDVHASEAFLQRYDVIFFEGKTGLTDQSS
jgi:hypothetical protein